MATYIPHSKRARGKCLSPKSLSKWSTSHSPKRQNLCCNLGSPALKCVLSPECKLPWLGTASFLCRLQRGSSQSPADSLGLQGDPLRVSWSKAAPLGGSRVQRCCPSVQATISTPAGSLGTANRMQHFSSSWILGAPAVLLRCQQRAVLRHWLQGHKSTLLLPPKALLLLCFLMKLCRELLFPARVCLQHLLTHL